MTHSNDSNVIIGSGLKSLKRKTTGKYHIHQHHSDPQKVKVVCTQCRWLGKSLPVVPHGGVKQCNPFFPHCSVPSPFNSHSFTRTVYSASLRKTYFHSCSPHTHSSPLLPQHYYVFSGNSKHCVVIIS